jgi:hypothetical protein
MPAPNQAMNRTARPFQLSAIDAAVAARLGPGRVSGNAQPAAFSRQVAMYLAKELGGWSTTQIGRFYNGRDHSTVCYAIHRIEVLREINSDVDDLLTVLTDEIRSIRPAKRERSVHLVADPRIPDAASLFGDELLDSLAERIASRVLSKLAPQVITKPPEPNSTPI